MQLGIFLDRYGISRYMPPVVPEIKALDTPARQREVRVEKCKHGQHCRTEILVAALQQHLQYILLQTVLGELLDKIPYLPIPDSLYDRLLDMYEIKLPVRTLIPVESPVLEEILAARITEIILDRLLVLLVLFPPELFISLYRLGALELPVCGKPVFASAERELRKILQLLEIPLAEFLAALEFPDFHNLGIRRGGDLVQLHISACHLFLVPGSIDIFLQVFLVPLERVGQQVIHPFVSCLILQHISEIKLDIQLTVLQPVEILLEVLDRIEEVLRTAVYRIVHPYMARQVEAVAVKKEYDLPDMAHFHQLHNLLRKRALISEVLDTGYRHTVNAMLAGFLSLLLPLLDKQCRDFLPGLVQCADLLRYIDECRRSGRRLVLHFPFATVEMLGRILETDPVIGPFCRCLVFGVDISDRSAVQVVIMDYRIVPRLVDFSPAVDRAWSECPLLELCLAVGYVDDRGSHILLSQTGIPEHAPAETLLVLLLLACRCLPDRFIILQKYPVVIGQPFYRVRERHPLAFHKIVQRTLAGQVIAVETLEHPPARSDDKGMVSSAERAGRLPACPFSPRLRRKRGDDIHQVERVRF